ncbi:MAG: HD domain-containing protein [Marinifilaceae bacterium]|jgi:class 3 adenylate cyclase/predicted metal-dependent HD superfamily phosphohydrolase|nr:HD domain-containing protein [Marinifilaceae bacterium]
MDSPLFSDISYVIILNFLILVLIIIIVWILFRRQYKNKNKQLEEKYKQLNKNLLTNNYRVENVVLNLLPRFTAGEFIKSGKIKSKRYQGATVLFADIQGFSEIAAQSEPENLIKDLDKCFMAFDQIIEKYNIEKIKTVGDAYMCVGGIPTQNSANAVEVVLAAMEFIDYLKSENAPNNKEKKWNIRIGVHTGTVIGGSIGSKQIHYDIWGDTVNKASRMESAGEIGRINISEETYKLVKNFFVVEARGELPIKYYGNVEMYFIKSVNPKMQASDNRNLLSDYFYGQFYKLKFDDLQEEVYEMIETKLSKKMLYHDLKHTQDVVASCEFIGKKEKRSLNDIILLKIAALLHDIGFIVSYKDHEDHSQDIARTILKKYKFPTNYIEKVCRLINCTKEVCVPKDDLSKIIKDSDLDYLGRHDYIPISNKLYLELRNFGILQEMRQWRAMQVKFLSRHKYYTDYSINNRESIKQAHLIYLRSLSNLNF